MNGTRKKQYILSLLLTLLLSCNHQESQQSMAQESRQPASYAWTKVLDSAEWKKNYNFQMMSVKDTLWTLHPDGNWWSINGAVWTKSTLPNAIGNLAFLDYTLLGDTVIGLGHFRGNIERYNFTPTIYKTFDYRNWTAAAEKSNLPARFFYHPFVFNSSIWIIGGEDSNTMYADCWNSTEGGIHWTKLADSLPLGKRSGSQVVNLHDTLYLLDNDVWRSTDAIHWAKIKDEIIPGVTIFGYAALVFDGKIWLLGCNRNGQFSSQVLSSSDGVTWTAHDAPWSPRGGIAATVYRDALYMTGGKYGGLPNQPDFRYSNDVWRLERVKTPPAR